MDFGKFCVRFEGDVRNGSWRQERWNGMEQDRMRQSEMERDRMRWNEAE